MTSAPTPPCSPTGQAHSAVIYHIQLRSPQRWEIGSLPACARARRFLNWQVINLACQAGGEVALANLAMACISTTYVQDLGIDEKIYLVTRGDPTSYKEVMACPDAEKWTLAMVEE